MKPTIYYSSYLTHYKSTCAFSTNNCIMVSQAGSKFTCNFFNQYVLKRAFEWCVLYATDPKICWDTSKVATYPTGVNINILCIKRGDHEHSCKEHENCGFVLNAVIGVCLQKVQYCIFLVEHDCPLFDFLITIDVVGIGLIMPCGLFILLFLLQLVVILNLHHFSPNYLLTFYTP